MKNSPPVESGERNSRELRIVHHIHNIYIYVYNNYNNNNIITTTLKYISSACFAGFATRDGFTRAAIDCDYSNNDTLECINSFIPKRVYTTSCKTACKFCKCVNI